MQKREFKFRYIGSKRPRPGDRVILYAVLDKNTLDFIEYQTIRTDDPTSPKDYPKYIGSGRLTAFDGEFWLVDQVTLPLRENY